LAASRSASNIGNQDRSELSDLAFRDSPPPCDKHEDAIVAAPRIAEAHWQGTALRPTTCFIPPWLMTAIRRFCWKTCLP